MTYASWPATVKAIVDELYPYMLRGVGVEYEDALQEATIAMWRARKTASRRAKPVVRRAYERRTVRNALLNLYRTRRRHWTVPPHYHVGSNRTDGEMTSVEARELAGRLASRLGRDGIILLALLDPPPRIRRILARRQMINEEWRKLSPDTYKEDPIKDLEDAVATAFDVRPSRVKQVKRRVRTMLEEDNP